MKSFIAQAQLYATYHQGSIARYVHIASIPFILVAFMIVFGFVHITIPGILNVNLAEVGTLILLASYFRLQWRLALALTPILVFLLWLAEFFSYSGPNAFSLQSFVIILLIGAALLGIAYVMEEKRPALSDFYQLAFIAPLFWIAEIFFIAGRMTTLQETIHGQPSSKKQRNKK